MLKREEPEGSRCLAQRALPVLLSRKTPCETEGEMPAIAYPAITLHLSALLPGGHRRDRSELPE